MRDSAVSVLKSDSFMEKRPQADVVQVTIAWCHN